MEKLLLIVEVHQLKKQGFKVAAIAKKLEISRNTVYKYLDMTFDEAKNWMIALGRRQKKLAFLIPTFEVPAGLKVYINSKFCCRTLPKSLAVTTITSRRTVL